MTIRTLFTLLLIGLFTWSGCDDDDPNGTASTDSLSYDGPNFTAPSLPPGDNRFAVYFPPSETEPFRGRSLERISFYVSDIPNATSVAVYGEGPDNRTPGQAILPPVDITQRVGNIGWYDHVLIPAIEITGEGLWLVVDVNLPTGGGQSIGCDQGRSYNSNGDLLFLSTGNDWVGFNDINGETVNWNIRGLLAAE